MVHGGTVHLRVCPVRLMRIMEEEEDAHAWFMLPMGGGEVEHGVCRNWIGMRCIYPTVMSLLLGHELRRTDLVHSRASFGTRRGWQAIRVDPSLLYGDVVVVILRLANGPK